MAAGARPCAESHSPPRISPASSARPSVTRRWSRKSNPRVAQPAPGLHKSARFPTPISRHNRLGSVSSTNAVTCTTNHTIPAAPYNMHRIAQRAHAARDLPVRPEGDKRRGRNRQLCDEYKSVCPLTARSNPTTAAPHQPNQHFESLQRELRHYDGHGQPIETGHAATRQRKVKQNQYDRSDLSPAKSNAL